MRKTPLTGITSGAFDTLKVRDPPFTGSLREVTAIVAGGAFDPSQLQADIASNAAALANKAENSAVYSQTAIDALVAPQATLSLTTLKFSDIDSLGVNERDWSVNREQHLFHEHHWRTCRKTRCARKCSIPRRYVIGADATQRQGVDGIP